ncbi:hypothetical protein P154DRAFT_522865 [Amniculicola lignicola CBS 123094]|uniref:Vacuolar protein-sorting-associated protein 46 n=1 Tax=Amniculicola lignicola CBS 123094 TaxID=1392246 RepID=A0A6A5WDY8_9PLEO|nr:hypothetical protein P154DRAFT_522865 [Amniculicola lignicola CBS 123094]
MSGLEKALFNLKFTAKQLNRQAIKVGKDEKKEQAKLDKAVAQGHQDIAKLYGTSLARKQQERINLLTLASRVDAVSSKVQTAVTMRQVTGNIANVVRGMDMAMKTMDLERISGVMESFEKQFDDLDVVSSYMETVTSSATASAAPQDVVDRLLQESADRAGVQLSQDLQSATPAKTKVGPTEEEEGGLEDRLRALRN